MQFDCRETLKKRLTYTLWFTYFLNKFWWTWKSLILISIYVIRCHKSFKVTQSDVLMLIFYWLDTNKTFVNGFTSLYLLMSVNAVDFLMEPCMMNSFSLMKLWYMFMIHHNPTLITVIYVKLTLDIVKQFYIRAEHLHSTPYSLKLSGFSNNP